MLNKNSDNLVWIDLEMTGLDPNEDTIIEIATIITDKDLKNALNGPSLVIHQPKVVLDNMNPWCIKHHKNSGLTEAIQQSKISLLEAEEQTLKFIKRYTLKGQNILCGNSVGQDQKFLLKYMPQITDHLHYRILDVSSIKEAVRRWYNPKEYNTDFEKKNTHRALDDINESIEELDFFRQNFFRKD